MTPSEGARESRDPSDCDNPSKSTANVHPAVPAIKTTSGPSQTMVLSPISQVRTVARVRTVTRVCTVAEVRAVARRASLRANLVELME